jgi:hypothetical protein
MMIIMHDSTRYGHLCLPNGKPMPIEMLARHAGVTCDIAVTLLRELSDMGIPRYTKTGVIYSKRMVEDDAQRQEWKQRQSKHRVARTPVTQVSRDSHDVLHSSSSSSSSVHTPEQVPSKFDVFWEAYPRKVGRAAAKMEWAQIPGIETHSAEIIAGVYCWSGSVEWSDPQFIPHPKTFLKEKRWQESPVIGATDGVRPSSRRSAVEERAAKSDAAVKGVLGDTSGLSKALRGEFQDGVPPGASPSVQGRTGGHPAKTALPSGQKVH